MCNRNLLKGFLWFHFQSFKSQPQANLEEFVEKEKADEESDSDDTDSGNCDGDLGDDGYPYLHLASFLIYIMMS